MNSYVMTGFYHSTKPTFRNNENKETTITAPIKRPEPKPATKADKVLVDKNYASLQINKSDRVAFKGAPNPGVKTLSDKISNLFNVVRTNDVIVATPNIKKGIDSLEKHLDSFKTVIKRIFFVEDKSLKDTVAFRKNLEDREIVNISDNITFIRDSKNQTVPLESGESGYLLPDDIIKIGETELKLTEHKETVLPIQDSLSAFVDFDEEVSPSILQINKKSLKKIQAEQNNKKAKSLIMFSDVGGQDNVIKALKRNILFPIRYPELNAASNTNKSVLLYGPPGTGKSLIAEATANESNAWFRKINASELDSKYVGESEENWRNLFEEARENQPAIIFIDEFDAIAKRRGGQDVYGDKTLNTLLGLMSDAEKRGDDIYMIAATNNRSALDPAAIRSGRFGVSLEVGAPDREGTKQILGIHTRHHALDKDFDMESIVDRLHKEKATGADIAAISAEARNNALEREHIYDKMENGTYKPEDMENLRITNEDFNTAIENFKNSKNDKGSVKPRNPIGYNSPMYK